MLSTKLKILLSPLRQEINRLKIAQPLLSTTAVVKDLDIFKYGLQKLASDKKYLGASIGLTAVLHTWEQNLCFHPHIHCIVPSGGLTTIGKWQSSRKKFFLPVRVLSRRFRGKFLALLKLQIPDLDQNLLNLCYRKEWVVYCKPPFKDAACVVEYLGRYTHRVAISNNRILKIENGTFTFKWRDYRDHSRWKIMTLSADEFIRRFLMHVLPTGFTKIRHYGFFSSRGKQKELNRVAVNFENSIINGEYTVNKNIRLSDFCSEYLELTKSTLAPRTWTSYKKTIDARIVPALGHIKLADLRPLHIQHFIEMLEEPGQYVDIHYIQRQKRIARLKAKGKPIPPESQKQEYLSSTTINRIHAVLQSILARALKLGLITSNPADCAKIDLPKSEQKEIQMLDEKAAKSVLQALESEPLKYQVMIHLALTLGCRRGELMALTWNDINFQTGTVSINHSAYKLTGQAIAIKEPKNKSSVRRIAVPRYCIDLLENYRYVQNQERLKIGDQWVDKDFLFTTWNGDSMNPDTPSKWFPKFLKRKELPHIKFHALRHSSATLALYYGANIKVVGVRLCHSQLSTTSRYMHFLKAADDEIAENFNGMFGKKAEKRANRFDPVRSRFILNKPQTAYFTHFPHESKIPQPLTGCGENSRAVK